MKNGVWREYKKDDEQSYSLLYNDLKDSGKDWYLTENSGNCYTEIHGRIDGGTRGGDVYVYYIYNGKKYVPEFYIKVSKACCLIGEEDRNYIEFNSSNIYGYKIKCEYFPELIKKLKEIDEKKNKKTIDKVKKIYQNHRKLLSLQKQESYTEKQLVFLYKMSASPLEFENTNLAKTILNGRNVQNDFDQMKLKNKVNLFLAIKETDLVNELFIDSKEVILALAQNSTLKQLQNTTEEIRNDKEYIMNVLENFFKSDEVCISRSDEFDRYLPIQYQTDIDIIKLTYYKYTSLINCSFFAWYGKNPELREKFKNPEFCYQVIDAFARSRIEKGNKYYESDLLPVFPEEVRNHIEEHVLIGPEPSEKRQQLKEDSIKILKKERDYVNSRLKK